MTNSWTETALGEVIELYDHERIPLSTQQRSQRQGGYPYYGASGIIDYIDDYIFDGRFLLISEDGANLVERNTPIAFFATGKFWVNNHSHVVRGIPEVADDYFLMSYIQSANISGYITGTAQPKLSQRNLKAIRLPLPPFPIQRKIAAVLSAYDDLIENNTRRIKILEEMAQAIYREWFVEFRFPGHEQVPMVESELGLIPQGWEVKKVEEFVTNHIGGGWGKEDEDSKHIVPAYVIRGTDFSEVRHLAVDTCPLRYHTQSNFKSRELKPNDIVMEISGGGKDWGVGRSILVTPQLISAFDKPAICASFCKKLVLNEIIFSPLIFIMHLQEAYNTRNLELYELRSTGIRNFQFPVFLQREQLPVPLLSTQRQFATQIQPLIDSIQNLGTKNANLRQTRDLLLPKLISGEIDVSELNIDTN